MTTKKLKAIHPGEILREYRGDASMRSLARSLGVPVTRLGEIEHGRRRITPETALRLMRHFGTTAVFWINMQAAYDLELAVRKLSRRIEREVKPRVL